MIATLMLCSLALAGDLVPDAIEGLLNQPEDSFFFGQPQAAFATPVVDLLVAGTGRVVIDVGDVTGDGAPDFAVGYGPGGPLRSLEVRDGRSGERVWAAAPGAGVFRSLRGLVADGTDLVAVVTSAGGTVERRVAATGALVWSTDLAPADPADPASVHAALFLAPGRAGVADVVVAAGHRVDAVLRLSGSDGQVVWTRPVGDVCYDVALTADLDGDGEADLLAVGGDAAPFVTALSGADGTPLWTTPLDGPGAVVVAADDIDGRGLPDVVIGQFAAPANGVRAFAGEDGAPLWTTGFMSHNVTSLVALGDASESDGITDYAVGSFDNAIVGVDGASGFMFFRREFTTNNGGMVLSVAVPGDLDGNGNPDIYATSVDHYVYAVDGKHGYSLFQDDLRLRGVAVAALADPAGDGRAELVAVGQGIITVLDGDSGIVAGPMLEILHNNHATETDFLVMTLPLTTNSLLASLGTAELFLPGWDQPFGLDPTSLATIAVFLGPPAGGQGFNTGPVPRELIGLTVHVQVAAVYANGLKQLSDPTSFVVQ